MCFMNIIVERDNLRLMNSLYRGGGGGRIRVVLLVANALHLRSHFELISFQHVWCKANTVAQSLAHFAKEVANDQVWLEVPNTIQMEIIDNFAF